ncbi:hypothetical protein B0I35DRAFT_205304 [Stachybotrys elegans]|uniref:Uncharacterized protein n=1 Tax=Stachybotrys elegans TaxID=80388 RepID=A0A8K0WS94_9HYPO|nr:hypothetical protein B0I35DRAFT_205304 [Stachybotrys elegans]
MHTATISTPALHVVHRQDNIELRLAGTMELEVPDGWRWRTAMDQLWTALQERHLWLVRSGICYMRLAVTLHGELVREESCVRQLTDLVRDLEIWGRLGIRLQESKSRSAEQIVFSIQHADLSSLLAPPSDADTAEFKSVSYQVSISKARAHASVRRPVSKRQRLGKDGVESLGVVGSPQRNLGVDLYSSLSPKDRRAVDDFVAGLNVTPPAPLQPRLEQHEDQSGMIPKRISKAFEDLIEPAVRMAILGVSQKPKGLKIVGPPPPCGLAQLAPAVFHMPHLRVITEQVQVLPAIATSLARMRFAESPRLRRKIMALTVTPTLNMESLPTHAGSLEGSIRGIEKQVWETVIKRVKAPTLSSRAAFKDIALGSQDPPLLEFESSQENYSLSTDETKPRVPDIHGYRMSPASSDLLEEWSYQTATSPSTDWHLTI